MKIHLISMLGIHLDFDILTHWIKHYKAFNLSSYFTAIHNIDRVNNIEVKIANKLLNDNGFKTIVVYGSFGEGNLRHAVFTAYQANIPDNEYILSVDTDEIQIWPDDSIWKHIEIYQPDMFEGDLIDCFGDSLEKANPDIPLNVQYPKKAYNLEGQLDPLWNVKLNHHKICMHKNYMPICYVGSHDMNTSIVLNRKEGISTSKGGIKVLHYRWRKGVRARLKRYGDISHADRVMETFK